VEANDGPMSSCAAPAGSTCRTGKGRVAVQYHTARFRLVPHLAKTLNVPVPQCASRARCGSSCPAPRRPRPSRPGRCGSGTPALPPSRQSLDTRLPVRELRSRGAAE
jgi:hypothetical protein